MLTRSNNYVLGSFLLGIYKIVEIHHFIFLYALSLELGGDSHSASDKMEAEMSAPTWPKSSNQLVIATQNLLQGNKWETK